MDTLKEVGKTTYELPQGGFINIDHHIVDTASGCDWTRQWSCTIPFPLIGGRLEKMVIEQFVKYANIESKHAENYSV